MAFTRLAYHRSYFLIGLGIVGVGLVVLFLLDKLVYGNLRPSDRDQLIIPILAAPLALVILARGLTGSWSKRQLRVDVPAGQLRLETGQTHALDELGELSITTRRHAVQNRHRLLVYELRAATVKGIVFESLYEGETVLRRRKLDDAVLQSRLRRVLEAPAGDGSAFRSGPDAVVEVTRIAGDAARARAALAALRRDHDASIRERAASVLAAL